MPEGKARHFAENIFSNSYVLHSDSLTLTLSVQLAVNHWFYWNKGMAPKRQLITLTNDDQV